MKRLVLVVCGAAAMTLALASPAVSSTAKPAGFEVRPTVAAWSASMSKVAAPGVVQALSDYSFASFSGTGNLLTSAGTHGANVYTTSGNSGDVGWSFTAQGGGQFYMHPSFNSGLCVDALRTANTVTYYDESCPRLDPNEEMQETGSNPSTHLYWPEFAGTGLACLGDMGSGFAAGGSPCTSNGNVEWDRIPFG